MLERGAHIGGARILRVLGEGDVATVYEVLHKGARRAMKVIEGVSERVVQEGEALAMIEHINVVRWYDTGIDGQRTWIVTELVEGQNLRELRIAAGGRLPLERAVALMRHACEGLWAVHKKGFVHRDIAPENILVTHDDIAKIADLGSVKLPGWGVKTTNAYKLSGMAYMPPELWQGASPTPQSDVYSAALIFYELKTGINPVVPKALDVPTMCRRHLEYEPPLLSDVPGPLAVLVQRALAKDPASRCTMRELADGLEAALDDLLVWRRAAARSVPLPNRPVPLAQTDRMPDGMPLPSPASRPRASESVGVGGTIKMAAISEPTIRAHDGQGDRQALPPEPSTPPLPAPTSSSAPTWRSPLPPLQAPFVPEADVRRSTGIPVESTARPSVAKPWKAVGAIGGGGLLLVAMSTATWWWVGGRDTAPKPAAPPPLITASASASNPPASSQQPPKPSASTLPRRAPRR